MSEISDLIDAARDSKMSIYQDDGMEDYAPREPATVVAAKYASKKNPLEYVREIAQQTVLGAARTRGLQALAGLGAYSLTEGFYDRKHQMAVTAIERAVGKERFIELAGTGSPWESPELISEARKENSTIPERDPAETRLFGLKKATIIPIGATIATFMTREKSTGPALVSFTAGTMTGLVTSAFRTLGGKLATE